MDPTPLASPLGATLMPGVRGPMTIRPVGAERFGVAGVDASRTAPIAPPASVAHVGTAHQTNADGDAATFSSKLDRLSDHERRELDELRERDRHVRTHEQSHMAAAGGLVRRGPRFTYKTGPDGTDYAVGGHVQIDTSPGATPEATIAKAAQMRRAALAPADPSPADRAVAAKAAKMEARARAEIARRRSGDEEAAATPSARAAPIDASVAPMDEQGPSLDVYA